MGYEATELLLKCDADDYLTDNKTALLPLLMLVLGPIVWALSLSWLAFDLQGDAYRKTIPIMLYLGLLGLRDGPEAGDDFWSEELII